MGSINNHSDAKADLARILQDWAEQWEVVFYLVEANIENRLLMRLGLKDGNNKDDCKKLVEKGRQKFEEKELERSKEDTV